MTSTGSVTLLQNSLGWEDQTTSAEQLLQFKSIHFTDLEHQKNQVQILSTLSQLAENTSDGGVRLDPNSLFIWSICINANSISRILLMVNPRNEIATRLIDHSLSLKRNSIELPLDAVRWIESVTGLSQDRIGRLIGVTRQAINAWKRGKRVADDNRQRIFAVRDVIERAASRYPTQAQLTAWLDTPRGADGYTPAQLLEANEINRARLLAISSPSSPHLVRPPTWVKQPVPEAFRSGAERHQEALPHNIDDELSGLISDEAEGTDEDEEGFPQAW